MLDYTTDQVPLGADRTVWSRAPLRPLVPTALTPFSYSVLAEMARLAWNRYYDRIGYEVPRSFPAMRHYQGRAYLNLSAMGQHDADFAGMEPLTFRVNGQSLPVSDWQKPGLLAALKVSRSRKKIADLLDELSGEMGAITHRAQLWYAKVRALKWSQAEILQIMEEIERKAAESLMAFFAARHHLEIAYNQLLRATEVNSSVPDNLVLVNNALSDLDGLTEVDMAERLLALSQLARSQAESKAWVESADLSRWTETLPDGEFATQLRALVEEFGHRSAGEGELCRPRWHEDPGLLLMGLRACLLRSPKRPARVPSAHSTEKLLDAVEAKQRKEAQQALHRARQTLCLQSQALHAFGYMLAGTRIWALAAAKEAMVDRRLLTQDAVFYFELEEIKQMMTGEWNNSDRQGIQATAEARRQAYARWQQVRPFELLIGDVEARPVKLGLTGVIGRVAAPLRRQEEPQPPRCTSAIVGAVRLDSGWAPILPLAAGFVTARGTPIDPIVAAARIWHIPTVLGLGDQFEQLTDGAQTIVDGTHATVEQ